MNNRPSLDPYGGGNFQSQSPGLSENFGGYGSQTYGIYADDDPGYQQPQQQVDPNDPYGYGQMQNGGYGGYGSVEEDPNPPFPPQQPNLNPYGQDGYGQDAWGR